MKIVAWNCCRNLSTNKAKLDKLKELDADIYVISECENPAISDSQDYKDFASNYYWIGENQYIGLGIFAKDKVKLELVDLNDNDLRYFIPIRVNDTFNILAVWTNPNMEGSKVNQYPKEITQYYEQHKDSGFFNEDMIICGDFNCDARLKGKHAKNVYEVVEKLSECGLVDTYHYLNNEEQGKETQATFFWRWNLNNPYHLDHIFAAPERISELNMGDADKWIEFSDHVPLTFEIK